MLNIDKSWYDKLPIEKINIAMKIVDDIINSGITVYPERNRIFYALNATSFDKVRVVILGQDPYHEAGQANGLAFSVSEGIALPPSLKNIFLELQNDIGGNLRTNGDLTDWAEQGILLLNSSLTVIEHKADSMKDLWLDITDDIIKAINKKETPVIFVLWGNKAQKKIKFINTDKHIVISSAHPSPLSAYRGFFGSKPFSKINEHLENKIIFA